MSENVARPRPPGWTDSTLFEFIEDCWGNTISVFANRGLMAQRLTEIDRVFAAVASAQIRPAHVSELLPALLFIRSLTAFRASVLVGTCLHSEGYAQLRACLENAGYAALIASDVGLSDIWLRRNDSNEAEALVRSKFTNRAVTKVLLSLDPKVSAAYNELYDRAIDWGAHPNEKSITSNLVKDSLQGPGPLQLIMLPGDGMSLDLVMRTIAQVAICVLRIFLLILPQAFDDHARVQIDALKQSL